MVAQQKVLLASDPTASTSAAALTVWIPRVVNSVGFTLR